VVSNALRTEPIGRLHNPLLELDPPALELALGTDDGLLELDERPDAMQPHDALDPELVPLSITSVPSV